MPFASTNRDVSAWRAFKRVQEQQQRALHGDPFYQSEAWLRLRYQTLLRYAGHCMCCNTRPTRGRLHVDHIKPRSRYPHLELDPENVQLLCDDCNYGKGSWDETDWRWK